jgi:enterochelin esterase-like enzyme
MRGRPVPAWVRRTARPVAAVAVGSLTFLVLRRSGTLADADAALQVMGFDPDRARLLTSFVAEAIVVAVSVLVTRAALVASLTGMAAGALEFERTFRRETTAAMATGGGGAGRFSMTGWAATLLAFVLALVIVAWATASLALIVRRWLVAAGGDVRAVATPSRRRNDVVRPALVAVMALLLAVGLPVFSDMVNYTPDVDMRSGGAQVADLPDASAAPPSVAGATLPPQTLDQPGVVPGAGSAAAGGNPGPVLVTSRPWRRWQPSGFGSTTVATFPAPWIGGRWPTATVTIYLPPGYQSSSIRYPVIYEVPWNLTGGWATAGNMQATLDSLITSGAMPASIVVFVSELGGSYGDAECSNTADGLEWFDTYLTQTVVPYVDGQFRTIATPMARAVMGFSQGGYCAPTLVLRHPDLFRSAIALSGYYQAGIRSHETPTAWHAFGGNPAVEAASSPLQMVARISPSEAGSLFFELEAAPHEAFFGPQYTAFASTLHNDGVPLALFPTSLGHSWSAVRSVEPRMLTTLGERWAALGVFG